MSVGKYRSIAMPLVTVDWIKVNGISVVLSVNKRFPLPRRTGMIPLMYSSTKPKEIT
ncbi:hypothetical protein [Streptococcus pluranimalium]|uniref:hypothetical protein n=1 Tax=Streptococcus pluranimalium TaxID=82348 RepID=UPI003F66582B